MMSTNEVEYDSDEEIPQPVQKAKKQAYVSAARNLSNKKVKKEHEPKVEDYDSADEAYGNMLNTIAESDEEDDLQRQLRLEREEAERLKTVGEEKKTKVDEDGTEYEWDPVVKGWFPKVADRQFFEYQQQSYVATAASMAAGSQQQQPQYDRKLLENTFYRFNNQFYKWDFEKNSWKVPESNAIYAYVDYMTGVSYEWNQEDQEWQAKASVAASAADKATKVDAKDKSVIVEKKKTGWVDVNEEKNTNVYVSGLPLDITDEEFEDMMSKYGIIMKDVLTHKLKIKLYRSEEGDVKGDGRCCYLMPESVKLCLQLLDGSDYKGHKVKVEKAKFELKGAFDPKKAKDTEAHKKKLSKKKEKQALTAQRRRLLDWDDRPVVKREKHEKVVVIKNLFFVSDLKKDFEAAKKLKDDLKKALEQYGVVKKVLIHENNPEGVATISFKDIDMADHCCEYLNNRVWKNGRVITCETWDGETKYDVGETEEERQKRIDEWHKFLEAAEEDEDDEQDDEEEEN